ncbi:hypothetical protein [Actinoplanes rishiriensis]
MSRTGPTRRTVLTATALGLTSLAGCDQEEAPPPPPDPLLPVLTEALALAAAYDRAVVAQPGLAGRLTPLAEDHRAHAAELARIIDTPAPSAAGPVPSAGAADLIADLRALEQAAQRNAVTACRTAPADRAALVGSIAACRATHAEALR